MKKRIIILGTIILLVIAAASAAWFYAAGLIRQEIENLAFADGETTPQLTCGSLDISGYPFAFDIDCTDAVIVSGDVLAEIAGIRASAMVYAPTHILASAKAPAELSDAFTGQKSAIAWANLEGSLRLTDGRVARLSIVGDDLSWNDLLFSDTLLARSGHAELHLLDMPEAYNAETGTAALALYMRANALDLPGAELTGVTLETEAEATGLPADLATIVPDTFLRSWQAAGGELKIVSIRASEGEGDLNATGNLALDAAGLLNGAVTIDSKGVAERIGAMIEEPWRTLVLGVPAEDGRHTNQLNFRAGTLSSGLIPVAALPPLF